MKSSRRIAAAMLVQSALAAPAWAAAPLHRVYVQPGQSPILALHEAQFDAKTAELTAKWQAAGHSAAATAAPTITSGAVTAATLTAGEGGQYPTIKFAYKAAAGLSAVSFVFLSPNKQTYNSADYYEPSYATGGTISFASIAQLSPWSAPGTWTLTAVKITDLAGNSTVYSGSQVQSLFKARTYTVANTGLADQVPPHIVRGSLPSNTVSLSAAYPLLVASITAADAGSGIWLAYVLIQQPGQSYSFYEQVPVPLPVARGAINADTVFASFDTPGTYNIVGYGVCDFAQNCTVGSTPAEVTALFGTDTFTLTQ